MALLLDISVSLDGFVAGPHPSLDQPLGEGGERLADWVIATRAWRDMHGMEGGETGLDSEIVEGWISRVGATVMGRRMFSGGSGPWDQDPNANGWWGDEPPFHHPVFVLTHHRRDLLELKGTTFTFVTDGIQSAWDQAREAAGDKDVTIGGGADAAQQFLEGGLVDEVQIHVPPVLLGGGTPLFDRRTAKVQLEKVEVVDSPSVTHLRFRVRK